MLSTTPSKTFLTYLLIHPLISIQPLHTPFQHSLKPVYTHFPQVFSGRSLSFMLLYQAIAGSGILAISFFLAPFRPPVHAEYDAFHQGISFFLSIICSIVLTHHINTSYIKTFWTPPPSLPLPRQIHPLNIQPFTHTHTSSRETSCFRQRYHGARNFPSNVDGFRYGILYIH